MYHYFFFLKKIIIIIFTKTHESQYKSTGKIKENSNKIKKKGNEEESSEPQRHIGREKAEQKGKGKQTKEGTASLGPLDKIQSPN